MRAVCCVVDNASGFPPIAAYNQHDDSPLGSDFKRHAADAFTRSVHLRLTMTSVCNWCMADRCMFFLLRHVQWNRHATCLSHQATWSVHGNARHATLLVGCSLGYVPFAKPLVLSSLGSAALSLWWKAQQGLGRNSQRMSQSRP
jgi:hypothetical protein